MAQPPAEHFGKRRLPPLESSPPVKRSGRVALLVMGTLAVGGGAYLLMPQDNSEPNRPGVAASATPGQTGTACNSGSSSSGWSSRSSYNGGSDTSSSHSSFRIRQRFRHTRRLRRFAHAISAHFSGG